MAREGKRDQSVRGTGDGKYSAPLPPISMLQALAIRKVCFVRFADFQFATLKSGGRGGSILSFTRLGNRKNRIHS